MLRVNPSAFFFNQIAAQPITNQSTVGLQVPNGQSLLLLGGDVRLDGGVLSAPGGRVELGGVAGSGTVGLNVDGNNLRLSFPDDVARADVSLSNGSEVRVTAEGGGSITVNARNLNVSGGSDLLAGIGEGLGAVGSKAGDVTLPVAENNKALSLSRVLVGYLTVLEMLLCHPIPQVLYGMYKVIVHHNRGTRVTRLWNRKVCIAYLLGIWF